LAQKKLPTVLLRAGEDRRVRAGHPWAFSNEILMDPETKTLPPGSLVILRTPGGEEEIEIVTKQVEAGQALFQKLYEVDVEGIAPALKIDPADRS
jgi:hypothetical protein